MPRLAVLPLLLFLAAPAAAAEQPAGRYVFVPVEAGTLRLDTSSGEVSLCTGKDGAYSCAPVPDEGNAGGEELANLADRLAALEARIAVLEARTRSVEALPDDETMDRVLVLADRMMRHFFGVVREMKRELESEDL